MLGHTTEFNYPVLTCVVIDGDTVRATLDFGFNTYKGVSVRIMNVDTPEVRSRDLYHKAVGHMVKAAVEKWIMNQGGVGGLRVESADVGKYYGRVVGDLYVPNPAGPATVYLSNFLLSKGLAVPYEGGQREWTRQALEAAEGAAAELIGRETTAQIRAEYNVDPPQLSDDD